MKKQKSALPSKLLADYEQALANVKRLEDNGNYDSYWHTKAARLAAEIETLQGANKQSEVKKDGSSN